MARIVKNVKITLLGYILLGLLQKQSQSGYDLRKLLATTPLMSYSDSPGAIYPALRRLKEQGLIKDEIIKGSGLRIRRICHLTPEGLAVLRKWLTEPVKRLEIVRNVDLLLMKFSLMDRALGPKRSICYLKEAEPLLAEHLTYLKTFLQDEGPDMPLSGRLALDLGVRSYATLLQWTRDAIKTYSKPQKLTHS